MTISELREHIKDYPDDSFVHIRIWVEPNLDYLHPTHFDTIVDKVQQGVDGSLLITGTKRKTIRDANQS